MSLIHDALKKAQVKDGAPLGSGLSSFQEPVGEPRPPKSRRIAVLMAVLLVVVGFVAYEKFSSRPSPEQVPQPIPAPTAVPDGATAGAAAGAPGAVVGGDAAALKRRALDSYKSEDYETAWSTISAAAQSADKDPEVWNNMGVIARKRNDLAKARESYEKALALKPDYAEALNNLAVLDRDEGNTVRARELLEKALKLQPAYPEASFNLALLYDKAGERKRAAEYYKRFLEVGGTFPSAVVESVRDRLMEIEPQ